MSGRTDIVGGGVPTSVTLPGNGATSGSEQGEIDNLVRSAQQRAGYAGCIVASLRGEILATDGDVSLFNSSTSGTEAATSSASEASSDSRASCGKTLVRILQDAKQLLQSSGEGATLSYITISFGAFQVVVVHTQYILAVKVYQ